jgi:hypothetical protein
MSSFNSKRFSTRSQIISLIAGLDSVAALAKRLMIANIVVRWVAVNVIDIKLPSVIKYSSSANEP